MFEKEVIQNWEEWSKSLRPLVLSDDRIEDLRLKKAELDEVLAITDPAVKLKMLKTFKV